MDTLPPVMGVDPNSKLLACVWGRPGEDVHFRKIKLIDGDSIRGTGVAFNNFGYLLAEVQDDYGEIPRTFMEAPVVGIGGPGSTLPQAYIQGAVMAACAEWLSPFTHVNNQTWKKRICGDGGISKQVVAERMGELWPDFVEMVEGDEDLIDAGAIFLYGSLRVKLTRSFHRRRGSDGRQGQAKEKARLHR